MPSSNTKNLHAYVGLGSNLGDRAGNLLLAIRGMISAGLKIRCLSSIYETEPVDVREQPLFLNMVAELYGAALPLPDQLLGRLLRIEYALGRRRSEGALQQQLRRGPRIIDLDLLLYGEETSATDFLILPHPRLHLRRFALVPLAEIAPHLTHPMFDKTINDLLLEVTDHSKVKLWQPHQENGATK
jgi:2-amino-4-hydroxy-6-hydroxymethyldihydropteridine diphosphokinase